MIRATDDDKEEEKSTEKVSFISKAFTSRCLNGPLTSLGKHTMDPRVDAVLARGRVK